MKKILLLFSILFLFGCTANESVADVIENAADKNAEIENAHFERMMVTKSGSEQIDENTTGSFIKNGDDDYDWYRKSSFGESLIMEYLQIEGKEYQKMEIPGQAAAPWSESPDSSSSLEDFLHSIFDSDLVDSEIAESQIVEQENTTRYILTMNEDYAARLKAEAIETLQENLEETKENQAEEIVIQGMENQLQLIEGTTYRDHVLTYEVDDEGFLTSFTTEMAVEQSAEVTYTVMIAITLTEYNLADTEGLLPSID